MNLMAFVHVIRRWLWLIVLAAFVVGGAAYAVSKTQPLQYEASTIIQVNAAVFAPNSTIRSSQNDQGLAQTYAVLVKTYPILEATVNKLSLPLTPDDLSNLIQTRIFENTSLLVVSVRYSDPARATDIANELARQLILFDQIPNPDQQKQIALLRAEIEKAQNELQVERDQLAVIDKQLAGTPSTEQATLTAERQALASQINAVQGNLAQMANTLAVLSTADSTNGMRVVEPARPPKNPVSDSTWINTALAAMVAAVLAAGIGFVIDIARQRSRSQPLNPESAPALPPENMTAFPEPPGSSAPKPAASSKKRRVKT